MSEEKNLKEILEFLKITKEAFKTMMEEMWNQKFLARLESIASGKEKEEWKLVGEKFKSKDVRETFANEEDRYRHLSTIASGTPSNRARAEERRAIFTPSEEAPEQVRPGAPRI